MLNKRPSAREELLAWAKARDFRERANEYLNRARHEPDGDVQSRFVDVARHYRILAEAEASNANRLGNKRRAEERVAKPLLNIIPALVSSPKTTGRISNLMLDPLTTAEIQALRLKLQLFASRQTDATVRSQCVAVDTRLAEVLEGDDPILRATAVTPKSLTSSAVSFGRTVSSTPFSRKAASTVRDPGSSRKRSFQ